MAVDYTGCACGGTGSGDGCCAPSTSTEPFCLADGSTILAVYQVGCAGCGTGAVPPTLSGYLDPNTGVFTAGPLPADAGRCSCSDCETIELCDTVITGGTEPEAPERVTNGEFVNGDITGWTKILANPVPPGDSGGGGVNSANGFNGSTGFFDFSGANRVNPTSIEQTVTVTPGVAYNLTGRFGVWNAGGNDPVSGRVQVFDGTGALLWSSDYPNLPQVGSAVTWPSEGAIASPSLSTTGTTMRLVFTDIGILAPGSDGQFQTDLVLDAVSLLGPGVPGTPGTPTVTRFLRTICRDCDGDAVRTMDTTLDGTTVYEVQGTVGTCSGCARQVIERCGCDDVNGDGSVINRYIELWSVDPCNGGAPELVGTWLEGDFDQPYTVVNPIDCPDVPEVFQHQEILCDAPAPAVGELVTNGTFATDTDGWTFFGGGTGNGWGPPEFGYSSPDGSAGVMAYNTGNRPPAGGISQTIATQAGATYQFKARVGARSVPGDDGTPMRMLVEVVDAAGGVRYSQTVAPTYTPETSTSQWPADGTIDVPVTATDGSLTLRFTDASTGAAVGVDLLLDDVSLIQTGPGTPVQFVRKYIQDAAGAVTDTVDFDFEGQLYNVVGTVGVCPTCNDCETEQLCDVQREVSAVLPAFGADGAPDVWHDLTNGVRWKRDGADGVLPGDWYVAGTTSPERFTFSKPVEIVYSVRFSSATAQPLVIPPGWDLGGLLVVQHSWDPATRTISPLAGVTPTGESTFRSRNFTLEMVAPSIRAAQPAGQRSDYGRITVTADVSTPFLRTVCRTCDGAVNSVADTTLDGQTAYEVIGTVGVCSSEPAPATPCNDCEQQILCDDGAQVPSTVTGTGVSTGTLSNGVTWTYRNRSAAQSNSASSVQDNGEGAWWEGTASFPVTSGNFERVMTFSDPVQVEFSVFMDFHAGLNNCTELPANVEVVSLPAGYVYDPAAGTVCVTEQQNATCSDWAAFTKAASARFRTTGPVTELSTHWLGGRWAACSAFRTNAFGAVDVVASGEFLRTICRNCDGTALPPVDTRLDGTTAYTLLGNAVVCHDVPSAPRECKDCESIPMCGYMVEGLVLTRAGDFDNAAETAAAWQLDGNVQWSNLAGPDNYPGILQFDANDTTPDGVATQSITVTPNYSYTVSGRVGILVPANSTDTATILVEARDGAGNVIDSRTVSASPVSTNNGVHWPLSGVFSFPVTSPDSMITLRFADVSAGTMTGVDALLDSIQLTDPNAVAPFLRTTCRNCDGNTVRITDTRPDGITPVNVTRVVPCGAAGTRDTEQQVLCSTSGGSTPTTTTTNAPCANQWQEVAGTDPASVNIVGSTCTPASYFRFSRQETTPDGVVAVQASGLTPNGQYQWVPRIQHFGSSGTGTFQVLDGATVLDANTVTHNSSPNLQNGGSWQDVPDLTFTAPASGTVTLRIADATPPPASGQDLAAMPGTLVLTIPAGETATTPFLRHTVYDPDGSVVRVYDTLIDGVTAFTPGGEVGVCSSGPAGPENDRITVPLCDVNTANGVVTGFLRHWIVDNATGDITPASPPNTGLDGATPYTPTGNVVICNAQNADQPVQTGAARITSGAWSIAGQGGPGTQSVTMTVLTGTATVTGTVGGAVTVPQGVTMTWSTQDTDDSALQSLSIAPGASSDVLIHWTRKATVAG